MTGTYIMPRRPYPQPQRPPARWRRRLGWPFIVLAVVLAVALFGGGIALAVHKRNEDEHQEMMRIVHSKEAKKVFDKTMRNLDPKAFTSGGVIRSYEIRDKAIARNPMSGIDATLYINNDDDLYVSTTLNENTTVGSKKRGALKVGGAVLSVKLTDLLDAQKEKSDSDTSNVPSQFEQWVVKYGKQRY